MNVRSGFNTALTTLLLLTPLLMSRSSGALNPHLGSSLCPECHLTDQVSPDQARMLVTSQEKLCLKCHPKSTQASHPSGFMPLKTPPTPFPLDWKGELTCSSCHLIHGSVPGLLRSADRGAAFCHNCHAPSFFERMPDHGSSLVLSGHLAASRDDHPGVELDPFSLQCLSCHDEKNGNAPQRVGMRLDGLLRHGGSSGLSHPVGRPYDKATSFGGYHPQSRLPTAVALPDGKVGCISCHQGYTKNHGRLTVDNQGSALCLSCHDL
ncbi:MAG: cytochrome c3 family protein [Magnetococcales bacterium]|nr:cytochrome c3 family protein [Magnetococcales bacterium]